MRSAHEAPADPGGGRDAAQSLAVALRLRGHEVVTAHEAVEAVEIAERDRPQVLLLDIGLPRLDGCGACRLIRERPWGRA